MKKFILPIAISLFAFTSCYDDYMVDNSTQAVGFANQTDVRTVVVGEGLKFSTGVALAGVLENEENRTVSYVLDNELVNAGTLDAFKKHSLGYIKSLCEGITALKPLPVSEYELVNDGGEAGKTVIMKGSHLGRITVKIDSLAYFGGSANLIPEYVLPLRISDAGKMDVMTGKETTVIGVRYENMLFGTYIHSYEARKVDPSGKEETISVPYSNVQSSDLVWTLSTVEPHALTANAVGVEINGDKPQMKLTLESDGKITIEPVAGARYQVEPEGESRFNRARLLQDRKIYLNYKYVDTEGNTWHMKDVLHFRNRTRDGVNEWQDENPEKYN